MTWGKDILVVQMVGYCVMFVERKGFSGMNADSMVQVRFLCLPM
jgi:hypothetical protein